MAGGREGGREGPVRVGPDQGELVDRAVEVLAGAFFADPLWGWAFPDPTRRLGQHRVLWRLFVEGAVRHSWVWLDAARAATAVWIPPGASELSPDQEARFEALVVEQAGPDADRVLGAFALLEAAHPHHAPHFYLSLLGTAPDRRGHGYGLALLAETLRHIDDLGAAAYLEASNLANVPLYARYGFAPLGRVHFPDGGPDVVTMWREPAGGTDLPG
jgi:GNAT superfamily N-acetyltransferase